MQAGHRRHMHEPRAAERDIEGVVLIKLLLVPQHQSLEEGPALRRENLIDPLAQQAVEADGDALRGKGKRAEGLIALDAHFPVIAVYEIVVVGFAEKGVRHADLRREADVLPGLRVRENLLIVIDDGLEARHVRRIGPHAKAAVARVLVRVLEHDARDLPRLAGIDARPVEREMAEGRVFQKPRGEEHERERRRAQPPSAQQSQSGPEQRGHSREPGEPPCGQDEVCQEYSGGKSQRRRGELSHA